MRIEILSGILAIGLVTPVCAQEPDIVGLRLGMSWADAKVILARRGPALVTPLYTISVAADTKASSKYGYPYQVNLQMAKGNETYNISLYPKSTSVKLSDPANLIVHRIRRKIGYDSARAPNLATNYTNLFSKYGLASEALNQKFQILISWLPSARGTLGAGDLLSLPINQPSSSRLYKCYSAPDVYSSIDSSPTATAVQPAEGFDLRSWSGWQSCGLMVRALVAASNEGLVQQLDMDMIDFRQFDIVRTAKVAAETQIKARMAADSNAAAPKQAL